MLTYRPGTTLAHRLDPRAKLGFLLALAFAGFLHTTPVWLAGLTVVVGAALAAARLRPLSVVWGFRFLLPFLVAAPLVEGLTLGAPWFRVADAWPPALASYRVLLVVAASAAYVVSTSARESRAAIQHTVPGRPGQFLGLGAAFVFRFLPVVRADLASIRDAMAARLGEARPLRERIAILTTTGLDRALGRADTFGLALRARCFAWNPTLPPLSLSRLDVPVLALSVGLVVLALL
jgi:biotin transport system permease protein